jgi:hypothetical protein
MEVLDLAPIYGRVFPPRAPVESIEQLYKLPVGVTYLFTTDLVLELTYNPEDGGSMLSRTVRVWLLNYVV